MTYWNGLKRTRIKPVSKKRQKILPAYNSLVVELRDKSGNVSDFTGARPDGISDYKTEPHHIRGRVGKLLTDPFNIIMLTDAEHKWFQAHMTDDNKQMLVCFIRPIRESQGYIREVTK